MSKDINQMTLSVSKDLRVKRGQRYDGHRDEIEEVDSGRCVAVAWVRRQTPPGSPRFVDDPEFSGFCDRMVQCTNACAGIPEPGKTIPALLELLRSFDRVDRGGQIPWVHNAAITDCIEKLRSICLAYSDVWNNQAVPIIEQMQQE